MKAGGLLRTSAWSAVAAAVAMMAIPVEAYAQNRGERAGIHARADHARGNGRSAQRAERRSERRARIERRSERRATRLERRNDRPARRANRIERRGDSRQAQRIDRRSQRTARQIERRRDSRARVIERRDARRADRIRNNDRNWNRERNGNWERNRTYADRDRDRTYRNRDRHDNWRDRDRWRDGRRYSDNRHHRQWNRDWRRDNRYDWRNYRARHRHIYRVGRYYAPYRNYSYRRIGIGFSLGSLFYSSRYWISDPWYYRLPEVYGPYRWIRYYDDALLVNIYSGEVVDVIYDFFW